MVKVTPRQRRTEGRVMHEFKHGELKSGRGGKAGKVKSRKQAIAIALSKAGHSKYDSAYENRKNRSRTARKEIHGRTAQQEKEGAHHAHTTTCETFTPRAANMSLRPCSVRCDVRSICSTMKARCGASTGLRWPPILPGATEPVRRLRCDHFTTEDTATSNRSDTDRQLSPLATVATTHSRRSSERALAIRCWPPPSQHLESDSQPLGKPKSDSSIT